MVAPPFGGHARTLGEGGAVRGLSQRDLVGILDFLRGAGAIGGPRTFAAYVTSELTQLIPAAVTAFADLDLVKRSVHWVTDRPEAGLPNAARVLADYIDENPFIRYRRRTGDAGAVRLSDLTTARTFQHTGLYREFYRPMHLHYSLACAVRLSQRKLAAIAVYRSGSDFSVRDRLCLNVLRPHLVQLHRSAEAISRARQDLALVTRGVEAWAHGFLIVDREGRIRRATEAAERCITLYCGRGSRPGYLPAPLQEWVNGQETARGRTDALPAVQRPFVIEREGRRLTVRLAGQPPDRILVLEETATQLEPAQLARLGLSSREAEVLAWVTAGKTNPAIAGLLHISPRTVQTHLDRVYRKLGVETRTAAAARALEAMREVPAGGS
jgi:DNA-binding CsgD family transcriptional regulator